MSNVQPIRLGELIKLLEQAGTHYTSRAEGSKPEPKTVHFDFVNAKPCRLGSYRGYYAHLALGWTQRHLTGSGVPTDKADELLAHLKSAIGQVFYGYKGGEYVMDERTPVWVDNYGECSGTAVTGIQDCGYGYIQITTGHCEDWAG